MAARKPKTVKVVKWLDVQLLVDELAERGLDAASVVITRTGIGAIAEGREMNAAEHQMEIEEVRDWLNQ